MGLAGRKQKQRIPADPRNLSWADDASRFGLSYLSKFGWDASQGLGSSGDGIKTHLKVQQKLDMMGIGAQHQRDPDGIAWKQNKDFEALLKRLNESADNVLDSEGECGRERDTDKISASVQEEMTTKKRKRRDADTDKKKKRKHPKSDSDDSAVPATGSSSDPSSAAHLEPAPKPRPMAHRARMRAAKRIAGKSAAAISEILGIAPSSSTSTIPSPSSTPTPQSCSHSLDNLTTSTQSVADYFKQKLLSRPPLSSPSSSSVPSGSTTPGLGASRLTAELENTADESEPRRGIGSRKAPPSQAASTVNADDDNRIQERKKPKGRKLEVPAGGPVPDADDDGMADKTPERESDKKSKRDKKRRP